MDQENQFDLLLPPVMAQKAEDLGVRKANMPFAKVFPLSVLAGAFISLGAIFCTVTLAGAADFPYGITRMAGGLAFCLGLILVVIGGAELFTGNNLIIMAWASGRIKTGALLRNWGFVYLGNFAGSVVTALLMFTAKQYTFGSGAVGEMALKIAASKVNLGFAQAVALGILCNGLVCLAVWLTYSGRSATDKILAILFPVTAFVAAGFEHSVANMYFIPYALLIKQFDPAFIATLGDKVSLEGLTWGAFFLKNLLPVTIGNIIGGALLVGAAYWLIYRADAKATKPSALNQAHPSMPDRKKARIH